MRGQENIDLTAHIAGRRFDSIAWVVTVDGVAVEFVPANPDSLTFNYEADQVGSTVITATVTCGSVVQEASLQFEVRG